MKRERHSGETSHSELRSREQGSYSGKNSFSLLPFAVLFSSLNVLPFGAHCRAERDRLNNDLELSHRAVRK